MDGTAEATQPIFPRLPQLTSLHKCRLPYCPYHRVASIKQPCGSSRCQSELRHNHSPFISVPSMLTCLPYIHLLIIQGSLYSIHPPKPRPPSSTSSVNFRIHYLFQQSFISILSTLPNHLKTFIFFFFYFFFFFFFFMNGNTERAQCALSRVCIP